MKLHLKSVLSIPLFKSEKEKIVMRVLPGKFCNYSIDMINNYHNKIIIEIIYDAILK